MLVRNSQWWSEHLEKRNYTETRKTQNKNFQCCDPQRCEGTRRTAQAIENLNWQSDSKLPPISLVMKDLNNAAQSQRVFSRVLKKIAISLQE